MYLKVLNALISVIGLGLIGAGVYVIVDESLSATFGAVNEYVQRLEKALIAEIVEPGRAPRLRQQGLAFQREARQSHVLRKPHDAVQHADG